MPIFYYTAYDDAGKAVSGNIEAVNFKEAAENIRKNGLYPKDLSLSDGKVRPFTLWQKKVSLAELASITRQLSTLLSSGTTLYEALSVLSSEEENRSISKSLIQIKESISGGSSLAKALEKEMHIFNEMYIRTVEAGETSGTLDGALARLSDYLEAKSRTYAQVRTALLYPAIMTTVAIGVLFFLFLFVLPKITGIFEDTRQALPLITIILLAITNMIKGYWPLFLIGIGGAVLGGRAFVKKSYGREMLDRLLLKLPFVKNLFMKFYLANFTRTSGTLLLSGVPVLIALDMTRRILNQAVFDRALHKTIKDITEGVPLSVSLKGSGIFPGILLHIIATGERSGQLDSLLLKAATSYEREFESSVARSLALLEPAIILLMGGVVGFIVLAILLPIFQLNQVIR